MKISVVHRNGKVRAIEVDAVGGGNIGKVCAVAGTVELVSGALVYSPAVMPWTTGEWEAPTGIVDEWTASNTGCVDSHGRRSNLAGSSVYSERKTVEERYPHKLYVLLSPSQLEGAISITIDGTLAYASEGGALAPATGAAGASGDGMEDEFAASNRPAIGGTPHGMSQTCAGVSYEPETM